MSQWWRQAVGYEVYIRSFNDATGDGIGDLPGLRQRLPYLAELGVDVVWITPFYPSPQADHGYDVADYLDIDPAFGTLDDLDAVVADAHRLGLKVMIDLVPNHTSDQHPWFLDARASRDAEHRDFYVWRDPNPDGGPPNNWVSHFGGPAWTFDETTGQYYLHLFLPEQPDLNWANPAVRTAFEQILEFWLGRGVDGFRIDVAHALVKDPELRDNPLLGAAPPPDASPQEIFASYDHRHDLDQPDVLEIYRRWRGLAREHDAVLLGEVYLLEPAKLSRYVDGDDVLDSAFCFPALKTGWDAKEIRDMLVACVAAGAGRMSWPLSSHDDPRAASRFGGGEVGARRAMAYLGLLAGLPGVPFLLQGDELGLDDGDTGGTNHDPIAVRNPGAVGRDGSRTPMLWEPGEGFGFTTGEPWLPFGSNRHDDQTVAAQAASADSHLARVRRLLAARREVAGLAGDAEVSWLDTEDAVIAFRRGQILVACHVGDGTTRVALPCAGTLLHATAGDAEVSADELRLPADATAYVHLDG
jgi:alpha-glucosidase